MSYSGAEAAGISAMGFTQQSIFALRAGQAVKGYELAVDRLIEALDEAVSREE